MHRRLIIAILLLIVVIILIGIGYWFVKFRPGLEEKNKDEAFSLLEDLKQATEINFSDIQSLSLDWNIETEEGVDKNVAIPL